MLSRALLIAALVVAPLAAQENLFLHVPDPKSKTRIEAVALFSRPSPGGFLPVRITVNNGSDQEGKIELATTCTASGYREDSLLNSSFAFDAPAEKSTRHDILVPCCTLMNYSGGSEGTINVSVRMSGSFGSISNNLSAAYSENQPAVL